MLYSYVCECGNKFDARQSIDQRARCKCDRCGQMAKKVEIVPVADVRVDLGPPPYAAEWTSRPKTIF